MMSVSLKKQMKMIEISDTFCPIVILSFIKISSDINSTMLGSIPYLKKNNVYAHALRETYVYAMRHIYRAQKI